jgi:hypothetical protein
MPSEGVDTFKISFALAVRGLFAKPN